MNDPHFQPSTVTKPIQLLAAWLIGLIAIDASFLGAASIIVRPAWGAGLLVIAAVANVPIFLAGLFLLQTKFRPEMQEDTYYAKYLERRSEQTGKMERISIVEDVRESSIFAARSLARPSAIAKSAFSTATRILLNDLLPGYSEIKKGLLEIGLSINSEFGSTSHPARPPKNSVLAFGKNCSVPILQGVIRISTAHGIQGIAAKESDVVSDGQIYI